MKVKGGRSYESQGGAVKAKRGSYESKGEGL